MNDTDEDRPWGLALGTAALSGILASLAGFVAAVLGVSTVTATSGVGSAELITAGLRALFTLAVVVVSVGAGCFLAARGPRAWWALLAGLGVLLDIWAWTGNALLAATLLSGGAADQGNGIQVFGFVVDLAIWIGVAWVAAGLGLRLGQKRLHGVQRLR